MKKKFKGALSLLLCMIMVFGAVAVGGDGIELPSIKGLFGSEAQAASEKYDIYTYEVGSDGTVTITDCDESAQGTITIPSQIDGKPVTSIGYMAFRFCDSLTSITIPNSVTSTFRGFDGCEKLTQINVDTANTVYSSVNGVLFSKDKTELIKYPEGKADTSYAIPNGVTSIGYGAFYDCYSLTSITIPDSVTSIGTMAFEDCSSLTSITIPDSVTSIDRHAFFVCRKLNQINVDTANTAYSSVNGVLFNKGKTELIRYPEGKADTSYAIPNGVTSIGNSAFYGCSNLTSITIPDGVTIIDINAFQYCRSLTSITIPDSVTYISAEAFDGCDSLKAAYYLGFSEQWAEVSIEWGNYRLTNHIVFKSNPEISDVASPTGTSVSMVGKHFYANIGKSGLSLSPGGKATGNQATCYVPVSSQDLDFTFESGNKNILVIGDTEVTFYGVYFIKFNVFGISEGTTTVTVRTSDGASSTAIVTVSETPTSDKILKGEGKLPANAKILVGTMDDYVTAVVLNSKKTYVSDVIIDQKTYPIQKNILPDATIEMFKGKPVIAVMQDGKITEIDLIENYITASVSTNFIDGTAIKDGDTHLVTASVSNTLPSRLMGADLSSLSDKFKIKINSVSIKIGSESVYSGNPYAEIGVDGFKIVASKEVKIKKSFANFNGEADIKVVVTGERNGTPLSFETKSSIKILSKSEWNKISESANKKKTEKQYDNEIKATVAKNSKNLKLDETIAWNATLGEFMSKKQLSALGYAMVGTIVMAEAPKATFTEYLTGKMLDKLGVAHKIAAGAFSVDVPMTVKIKTYKYGELVIDFEAHATNYTLGGKSYGSFGDVTYEITGGSGLSKVPTSMRSGLAGAIAYADVNTFADAMYDIALAEVKKAYNLGYGNDFNTVCDVFFNDTIVDVMLSACKTDYKGAFFDIISYPARQYKGACPIEMRVYDPSNELCGFVSDSKAVSTDENVECTVEGHTKIITVYGYKANDYKVEITATGSGVMNLEASDYAGSCRKLGSQTFTDFPIECGKTYSYICGAVSLDESSKT